MLSDSFGLRLFKAENMDDLTVEQFNVMVEYYVDQKEKELAEQSAVSPRGGTYQKSSTVRITNK